MSTRQKTAVGLIASVLATSGAMAKVSPEEAAVLGSPSTTYIGAERAGNADGSIPAWDGGFKDEWIPSGWESGEYYPNPFPNDEVLFTINASNYTQYKDRLTPGQIAMIEAYPDTFYMNVYPSRRTAKVPDSVKESIIWNATNTELANEGQGMVNFREVTPFPIPSGEDAGIQAIWNHIVRWRGGIGVLQREAAFAPQVDGSGTKISISVDFYFNPEVGQAGSDYENVIFFYISEVTAPSRLAGEITLLHETVDQSTEPRLVWQYSPGQRRVRRAPDVGFDYPSSAGDGMTVADQVDGYNGSPERYDWKLLGKREVYIPYNSYEMNQPDVTYDMLLQRGHIDQEYQRYELHRVYEVEATLKPNQRHVYERRVMFLDEDTWQVTLHDMYDGKGQLWRTMEVPMTYFWDVTAPWLQAYMSYDLLAKRYYIRGLVNEEQPYVFTTEFDIKDFTPSALRRRGRR
ncbi:MAG: DUF1329 domain-containing protein [Pseudomonadota bacterium]|nr:DUF1329 domain-containing protein [Pseudomonadota bacterium]